MSGRERREIPKRGVSVSTKKNEKLERELAEAREAVQPNLLLRTLEPESVVFHVGLQQLSNVPTIMSFNALT